MKSATRSTYCISKRLLFMALLSLPLMCCKGSTDSATAEFTVTFDAKGGTPTPQVQTVLKGTMATLPSVEPTKDGEIFVGWYTQSGIKFNFTSSSIDMDITLEAKWWKGPDHYVFLNDSDWAFNYDKIAALFGSSKGKSVAVGQGVIFYCFERKPALMKERIAEHLRLSLEYEIPVLVQLDAITFMDERPDLWNWWDENGAGYNPANKENVEWTSWSSDDAVKIGWLNWGRQIRLAPMPNLMSPTYRKAVKDQMTELIQIVADWYGKLPSDKKYLLGGVKVTGEMAIGVNNWHYKDGNSYIGKDPANDPQTGINMFDLPSRGVQTIGYAALKTSGKKTSGAITADDIARLAQEHSEIVSKLCYDLGIPRDHVFAHAGGVGDDLKACVNTYSCPAWSFYLQDAKHPAEFKEALNILESSDAPYFGIAEWSIGDTTDPIHWADAIREGLSIPRCRFLSVYANVVGNDYYLTSPNLGAIQGIKSIQ